MKLHGYYSGHNLQPFAKIHFQLPVSGGSEDGRLWFRLLMGLLSGSEKLGGLWFVVALDGTEGCGYALLAQLMSFSSPWNIHLLPETDVVVTVGSSMKALIGGCRTPDLIKGPLHSTSADLKIMFMVRAKRMTEMVQHVIMPFSSR